MAKLTIHLTKLQSHLNTKTTVQKKGPRNIPEPLIKTSVELWF